MISWHKINTIYKYANGILIALVLAWYSTAPSELIEGNQLLYMVPAYALLSMALRLIKTEKLIGWENKTLAIITVDAILISVAVRYTGGLESQFYLVFFPLSAFAGLAIKGWRSLVSAIVFGLCSLASIYDSGLNIIEWQTLIMRTLSVLSVGLVSYLAANFIRASEKKMLKTLDILNERTWELESSQAQLANIYDTTRAISGILNFEDLLREILRVGQEIFRLQKCYIYLSNVTNDCLYLNASLENGNKHILKKPIILHLNIGLYGDFNNRTMMLKVINAENRRKNLSQIDLPLISSGKIIGLMQVVSDSGNSPSDKELKLLMVFANSVAVAIDNSILHKKTEELTIVDELTELYNYRYFQAKLSDEIRRADRYHQKMGLLMLDLDHFKEINDAFGHQTGNIVLKEVAGILKQCIRDVDIVARFGGEEFMVILPQTEEHDALAIAERIRTTIEKSYFSNSQGQRDIKITISIGVCCYPDGVHTIEQLLDAVDKALYSAKIGGRNKVVMAVKPHQRPTEPVKIEGFAEK